ncbi:hypothetical protein, conserved [Eimeria acervulina]|uniref:Uncharacterized protein n=1 Tax=Eimeria acervulina TaxID=5801 RepID=U6GE39_EIMAC|nr:hypothetical protein, conserved [Eimeria acervulina]CDI78430.1 hypothetical protein, conserved [Eimeria acervulina]
MPLQHTQPLYGSGRPHDLQHQQHLQQPLLQQQPLQQQHPVYGQPMHPPPIDMHQQQLQPLQLQQQQQQVLQQQQQPPAPAAPPKFRIRLPMQPSQ